MFQINAYILLLTYLLHILRKFEIMTIIIDLMILAFKLDLELETECVSAAFVLTALRTSCENLFSVSSKSRIIKTYQ